MSSRPPLGVQSRQPQRSLSGGPPLSQRPPHPRTLSQQVLPPSPARKESFVDLTSAEPADAATGRNGAFKRAPSKLKLELSNDAASHHADLSSGFDPIPRVFTPTRMLQASDASRPPSASPHASVVVEGESDRLPMPQRRDRFAIPSTHRETPMKPASSVGAAPAGRKDGRPKPWTVEVPLAAPRFPIRGTTDSQARQGSGQGGATPSVGHVDFFPWTGGHVEDQLTEGSVRSGFFDKPLVAQTETSSAKASLFPMLKHKSGLHMLSTIFTGVLAQRKHAGQINSKSTFKLPPRVTATDTRKEAWLRDIASPDISLRKLSKTIPHGIRGKVLLEQCLLKNIPLDRAVWLARCVGILELRSFKRKGVNNAIVVGGEAKWIKEWTTSVEQFVEARIAAFGEEDWKNKVTYAIRLATNLFAEHLLDREHYMDWLAANLENTNQAKLPMWLLITQIYFKYMLTLRRYGRRLVNILLTHHHAIHTHPDKDVMEPIATRLSQLLSALLVRTGENFISPSTWPKHKDSLHASLREDPATHDAFKHVSARNEQLLASSVRSQPAARSLMVKLLDSTLQASITHELPTRCWGVSKDKPTLVRTLLEWCTSLHRPGFAKVYVAVRLLTSWKGLVDVTTSVLDFLSIDPLAEADRRHLLYHLVCELLRSGHFSMSTYIRWLIARGGMSQPGDVDPDGPCPTRLLAELPTSQMSDSLRQQRASLLYRAQFDADMETHNTQLAIRSLQRALGLPLDPDDALCSKKPMKIKKLAKIIRLSSRALKSEVGSWLSLTFGGFHPDNGYSKQNLDGFESVFNPIRIILESANDFSMLANILRAISNISSSVKTLASCADTINLHRPIFAAIGCAQELFDTLYGRLKMLVDEQGLAARPLLLSLANLASRMPGLEELGGQLHKDLVRSDRSTAVDACSPVSDNMAGRLQDAETELHEEIEKFLSNGTVLDKNTLERFFGDVVGRLQGCWDTLDERNRTYAALLARLRLFNPHHFDALMMKWLQRVRVATNRPSILQIFPVLLSLGSLSIPLLLATVMEGAAAPAPGNAKPPSPPTTLINATWRSKYIQEVLQLMMSPLEEHPILTLEECYSFTVLQMQARQGHYAEVLLLVRNALAEYSLCRQRGYPDLPLDNPETQDQFYALLKALVVLDPPAAARGLAIKGADNTVNKLLDCATTKLLLPGSPNDTQISFDQVLDLTNEYTLPFCQLKLSSILAMGDGGGGEASERMQSQLEMFAKAMDRAIDARNITWTGMLSCLSPEITQHLKNRAQARFFDILPSARRPTSASPDCPVQQSVQMAENLLAVVDAMIRGGTMGRPPQMVSVMVDRLADLWEILATGDSGAKAAVVQHWLPFLLTFITLHTTTFDPSKAGNDIRARALLILAGLMQELDSLPPVAIGPGPSPVRDVALAQRVFDLALVLVDHLAEDSRLNCVRMLKDATSDRRLRYLFSHTPLPNAQLMVMRRPEKGAAAQASAAAAATAAAATNAAAVAGNASIGTPAAMSGGVTQRPMIPNAALLWSGQQPPSAQAMPPEKMARFTFRAWDAISDTSKGEENDAVFNLSLFEAVKLT